MCKICAFNRHISENTILILITCRIQVGNMFIFKAVNFQHQLSSSFSLYFAYGYNGCCVHMSALFNSSGFKYQAIHHSSSWFMYCLTTHQLDKELFSEKRYFISLFCLSVDTYDKIPMMGHARHEQICITCFWTKTTIMSMDSIRQYEINALYNGKNYIFCIVH